MLKLNYEFMIDFSVHNYVCNYVCIIHEWRQESSELYVLKAHEPHICTFNMVNIKMVHQNMIYDCVY